MNDQNMFFDFAIEPSTDVEKNNSCSKIKGLKRRNYQQTCDNDSE